MSGTGNNHLSDADVKILRDNLFNVIDILEENHIKYWIDYGTLLGAIRNGKVIRWDKDSDIGVSADDISLIAFLLQKNNVSYIDKDVKLWVYPSGGEERKKRGSYLLGCDIFGWEYIEDRQVYNSKFDAIIRDRSTPIPGKYIDHLSQIEIEGRMVSCPSNPKEFIELPIRYHPGCITEIVKTGRSGCNEGRQLSRIKRVRSL